MQEQPHLIELGLARLKLMEAFSLISLKRQVSQNFWWVIRTDPHLDDRIKQPLLALLKNYSNHILIATNEIPKSQLEGLKTVKPKQVWSGNLQQAWQYIQETEASPSRLVLETRLDADDGLHRRFVERMQASARQSLHDAWRFWCTERHVEWQYASAWESTEKNDLDSPGSIVSLQFLGCITAGLTAGYFENSPSSQTLPVIPHHELHRTLPECGKDGAKPQSKCWSYLKLVPGALRARTPTSAGMWNVLWRSEDNSTHSVQAQGPNRYLSGAAKQQVHQEKLWQAVQMFFGMSREQGKDIREYVKQHLRLIAADNLKGQCTKDHSCKNSTQQILKKIIESSENVN